VYLDRLQHELVIVAAIIAIVGVLPGRCDDATGAAGGGEVQVSAGGSYRLRTSVISSNVAAPPGRTRWRSCSR
jgi:hypothetical protein